MLLQNLQTAALLIIVCECGWHKIALCQNALPLQIKAFCCSCGIFGPVAYGVYVFVVKAVSEALCLLVPFGRRCISLLLKGFPRSGRRSVHAFLVRWCLAVLIYTSSRLIINWTSVSSSKTCFDDNELTQTVMDTGQRWLLTLLSESTSLQNPSFSLNVLQLETGHS